MEYLLSGVVWFALSLAVASMGASRKIGYTTALFIALLLSPVVGLIVVLLSDKKGPGLVSKYNAAAEAGQREEYKQNYAAAIDNYRDAIYYAEKIPDNRIKEKAAKIKAKVAELQQKSPN